MAEDGPYAINLSDEAKDDVERLDKQVARRILDKLDWLAVHVEEVQHVGLTCEYVGLFRLRVGDYRILYAINHVAG